MSGDDERWEAELNGMAERSGSFGRKPTEIDELFIWLWRGERDHLFWAIASEDWF
jgi:hypothetical protein